MVAKPVRITTHAGFEIKRRGIRSAEVVRIVLNPGQVVPSRKGRFVYQSRIGASGRMLLRVVVKEDAYAYHVITAYKTSKVAKYWRHP